MADPVRELFDEFKSEGIGRIDRCIQEKQKETLYIDFKQSIDKDNRPTGDLTDDGRRILSENISAFANSGGGILVWGIRDRGHYAEKKIPIPNVDKFVVQLYRTTQQATAPPMDGVEHISIVEEDGSGYAVTYVPDGKAKPYMAVQTTEQYTYFMRSGDSSKPMPDVLVRALVTAGARPSLSITYKVVNSQRTRHHATRLNTQNQLAIATSIEVTVENDGSVIVEDVALAIEDTGDIDQQIIVHANKVRVTSNGESFFAFMIPLGAWGMLYPGSAVELGRIDWVTAKTKPSFVGTLPDHDLTMRYAIYGRNFTSYGVLHLRAEDLPLPI